MTVRTIALPAFVLSAALSLSSCTTNTYPIEIQPERVVHHTRVVEVPKDESPSGFRATSPDNTTTEIGSYKTASSPDVNKPEKNDPGSFSATKR